MENNDADPDPGSAGSISTLLCPESPTCLHDPVHDDDDDGDRVQGPENIFDREFSHPRDELGPQEDAYVATLLDRENGFGFGAPASGRKWMKLKHARLESIDWVMRSRTRFGFRHLTAYSSIAYFDRFLSLGLTAIRRRKKWAIRLLAVTCLSLAAKMEEVRVPALSEYGADSAAFSFANDSIKRMEIMVLNGLRWEMGLITPFCFMHFFIRKFQALPVAAVGGGGDGGVTARAARFIFAAVKVASTMAYRPSVLAAAATLAAADLNLSKEALERKISSSSVTNFGFTATDHVHSCYELMRKLEPDHQLQSPKRSAKSQERSSPVRGALQPALELTTRGGGSALMDVVKMEAQCPLAQIEDSKVDKARGFVREKRAHES